MRRYPYTIYKKAQLKVAIKPAPPDQWLVLFTWKEAMPVTQTATWNPYIKRWGDHRWQPRHSNRVSLPTLAAIETKLLGVPPPRRVGRKCERSQ